MPAAFKRPDRALRMLNLWLEAAASPQTRA